VTWVMRGVLSTASGLPMVIETRRR